MNPHEKPAPGSLPGAEMFVWGTWALMLLMALVLVIKYTWNYPFSDEIYLLTRSFTPRWLWEQHAEHRVPLAKLIWLGSLRLTNYNFRVANSISVIATAAAAFAMIVTAKRLRGWTAFSDSFFPMAFLNQGFNFLWSWVFNHMLAPLLACCLLMVILLRGNQLKPRSAIVTGLCLVLLSLSGPIGLPYALALATWLGYQGILHWPSASSFPARRNAMLMLSLAMLAVLLVGLYFVGYDRSQGIAAKVPTPGLKASLATSIQVLSISFGAAVAPYWRVVGLAVLMLLLLSVAVLISALLKQSQERLRALGLLLFIAVVGPLVLIVGRARAGLGEEYALSGIYLNMALPALSFVYLIWIIYGKRNIGNIIQMCLFTGTCLFFLTNLRDGIETGRYFSRSRQAFEQDMRAGVPPFILAERHIAFLDPSQPDVKEIASSLRNMQQAGVPQFRDMARDPAFREVTLPVVPVGMNLIKWDHDKGYSYGEDTSQASLDFALTERQFLYAIRLTYSYGEKTDGWATFRMSWETGNRNSRAKPGPTGCENGVTFNLETLPHDLWSRYRARESQKLTVWVNSSIDGFRICPDTRPFSFAVSDIKLLAPK